MAYQSTTDDVDLREVYTSFKNRSLHYGVRMIKFIQRNFWIIAMLLALSFAIGYLADKHLKRYKSTIIVTPNFNTADYLYEKVELLESKISQDDWDYLSQANITEDSGIKHISVDALPDIYTFVNKQSNNLNVFKILSENADAEDVVVDPNTARNYARHLIEIKSSHKIPKKTLVSIMEFLNNSEYYEMMRNVIYNNVEKSISVNEESIKQVDDILAEDKAMQQSQASVYISEDNKMNEFLDKKLHLVEKNHQLSTHLYNLKYIITPVSYFPNMNDKSYVIGNLKFILPFLVLCLFMLFHTIKKSLRSQPNELA